MLPAIYEGPKVCGRCHGEVVKVEARQDPLFLHGGYGEARVETIEACSGCCRVQVVRRESVRPWAA